MSSRRRGRREFALAALIAVVVAAVAAGLALATTGASPIGTGVVVIKTRLAYEGGQAAGTGMVVSSSGEVLTNNHVIRGATAITIVVPGTGRSYRANVVGYDVSHDVALLRASGASNLRTVSLGNSSTVKIGQAVTAIGNAGGTGSLSSSSGAVTALARSITVNDDQGGGSRLTGLIETSAALQAGDSGGALLSSSGKVIGMNTAASVADGPRWLASTDGYAIPINRAVAIVRKIENGKASATIHVGGTAFLGVTVGTDEYGDAGAVVVGVVAGGPADKVGIVPGDTVTGFAGRPVTSPTKLSSLVLARKPGERVTVTYVDQAGAKHRATVTLGSGPPQ